MMTMVDPRDDHSEVLFFMTDQSISLIIVRIEFMVSVVYPPLEQSRED